MLSSCVCCWCSWLLQCRRTVLCLFMYCISFSFVLSLSFSSLVWLSRSSLLMDWSVWRRSMTWPMVSNSNVIKKGEKREEKCKITIQNFRYWNRQNVYNVHFWEPIRVQQECGKTIIYVIVFDQFDHSVIKNCATSAKIIEIKTKSKQTQTVSCDFHSHTVADWVLRCLYQHSNWLFCVQLSKSSHLFEQSISALYPVSSSNNSANS